MFAATAGEEKGFVQQVADAIDRAARAVLFVIKVIVSILLVGSVLLIVATAVGRYFFDAPIRAQAEYLRYALTAIVFLGAVLVTWDDRHLKMDLLSSALGGVGRMLVNGLALIGFMFAVGYATWYSIFAALDVGDAESLIAEIPMIYPHAIIPIGLALITLALLLRMGTYVRGDAETRSELDKLPQATERTPVEDAEGDPGDTGAGNRERDGR